MSLSLSLSLSQTPLLPLGCGLEGGDDTSPLPHEPGCKEPLREPAATYEEEKWLMFIVLCFLGSVFIHVKKNSG
jgi:hypothetical protein